MRPRLRLPCALGSASGRMSSLRADIGPFAPCDNTLVSRLTPGESIPNLNQKRTGRNCLRRDRPRTSPHTQPVSFHPFPNIAKNYCCCIEGCPKAPSITVRFQKIARTGHDPQYYYNITTHAGACELRLATYCVSRRHRRTVLILQVVPWLTLCHNFVSRETSEVGTQFALES